MSLKNIKFCYDVTDIRGKSVSAHNGLEGLQYPITGRWVFLSMLWAFRNSATGQLYCIYGTSSVISSPMGWYVPLWTCSLLTVYRCTRRFFSLRFFLKRTNLQWQQKETEGQKTSLRLWIWLNMRCTQNQIVTKDGDDCQEQRGSRIPHLLCKALSSPCQNFSPGFSTPRFTCYPEAWTPRHRRAWKSMLIFCSSSKEPGEGLCPFWFACRRSQI